MAAICAKEAAPKLTVCVSEAQIRTGKKLLATGNGRCNLMNLSASCEDYSADPAFVAPALDLYRQDYPALWGRLGLNLRNEGGLVYPASNQASTVLDVLRLRLSDLGIEERISSPVTSIKRRGEGFVCGDICARRVILATGSRAGKGLGENESYKTLLSPFSHRFTPVYPALTFFTVPPAEIAGLKGMRLKTTVTLMSGAEAVSRETGEILFSDESVSGIAAMQLSLAAGPLLAAKKQLFLRVEPFGGSLYSELERRRKLVPQRTLDEFLTGLTVKRIALTAYKRAGISPLSRTAGTLTDSELKRLDAALTLWDIPVTGTGSFREAQVMLGGVSTTEFNPETMESKLVPGLYCCGEMLDVTGKCGGYNLEWAWASGSLAGRKAALSL